MMVFLISERRTIIFAQSRHKFIHIKILDKQLPIHEDNISIKCIPISYGKTVVNRGIQFS